MALTNPVDYESLIPLSLGGAGQAGKATALHMQQQQQQQLTPFIRLLFATLLVAGACTLTLACAVLGAGRPRALTSVDAKAILEDFSYTTCLTDSREERTNRVKPCNTDKAAGYTACARDWNCRRGVVKAWRTCYKTAYACKRAMDKECRYKRSTSASELPDACPGPVQPTETTSKPVDKGDFTRSCTSAAHSERKTRKDACKKVRESAEVKCRGKKKATCRSEVFQAYNRCESAAFECSSAIQEKCLVADPTPIPGLIDELEACEEKKVTMAPGEAVELRDGWTYEFRSMAGCPHGRYCDHAAYTPRKNEPMVDKTDSPGALFRLDLAENPGEFHIAQSFRCRYGGKYCNTTLRASSGDCPSAKTHDGDYKCHPADFHSGSKVPFKFTPVPDKPDQFIITSAGKCDWKDCWLAIDQDPDCVKKEPKLSIENFEVDDVEKYAVWRLVARAEVPAKVTLTSNKTYNFYTMAGCTEGQKCSHALNAPGEWPNIWNHEHGTATPLRLEAVAGQPGEFYIRNTYHCSSGHHTCNRALVIQAAQKCKPGDCRVAAFLDQTPQRFKISPVPGSADLFTIRAQQGNCPDGDFCGWRLAAESDKRGRITVDDADIPYTWRFEEVAS